MNIFGIKKRHPKTDRRLVKNPKLAARIALANFLGTLGLVEGQKAHVLFLLELLRINED